MGRCMSVMAAMPSETVTQCLSQLRYTLSHEQVSGSHLSGASALGVEGPARGLQALSAAAAGAACRTSHCMRRQFIEGLLSVKAAAGHSRRGSSSDGGRSARVEQRPTVPHAVLRSRWLSRVLHRGRCDTIILGTMPARWRTKNCVRPTQLSRRRTVDL